MILVPFIESIPNPFRATHRRRLSGLAGMLLAAVVGLGTLTGWAPGVSAFERWSEDRVSGNCANCHGGFRDSGYVSFTDGTPWGTSLHDGHRQVMLNFDCDTCHMSGTRFPVFLNSSAGGTGFSPIGCVGCHGRQGDENAGQLGAGLRQHHTNAGAAFCGGCHGDNDPSTFTTVAESEPPPYYFTPDPAHPAKPTDPCNANGSESVFGATGLDNDGDLAYDAADSDCAAAEPNIAVSPLDLNFGVVFVGDSSALTTQIDNTGTADLTVSGVATSGGTSAEFSISAPATPFTVAAGGSQTVTVTYAPVDPGTDSGALEITSDDPDEPTVSVTLSGTGELAPVADINLDPSSLDFGTVTVGNTSTLTSQIQNLGTADLEVTAIGPTGGTSAEFSVSAPATPFTIAVGGSQAISVTYAPTDATTDTGAIAIDSNDPDEPTVELALSGTGTTPSVCDIVVNPLLLDFGSVVEGTATTLSTSVSNGGSADCTVDSLVVSGDPEFALGAGAPATPFTLGPGGSSDVPVTYSPPAPGTHSGTLTIGSNDPAEPSIAVDLAGEATAAPVPDIALDPTSLDFGTVTVGSTATLSSQVQNLGTADLMVSAIDLCAGTSTEFSFNPLASMTIAPGGSETLEVTYGPSDSGTDSGCIAIASNDPDEGTVELGVTGTGTVLLPDISLAPTSLDFGVVFVGDTATMSATISNVGDAALSIDNIDLAPGTSPEFSFTAPVTPFTIPAGGSQTVSVAYAPVDNGVDTGGLEIFSDDPDEPVVTLDLAGTGEETLLIPDIALVPTDLAFGTVMVGNTSTLSADIQNLGNADLEIFAVDLCASTSAEFSFAPLGSMIIAPGASQSLSVTYAPADVGDDTGCLSIASSDPDEPVVELGVSGTGAEQPSVLEVGIRVPRAINPGNRGVTPVGFYADMDLEIAAVTCGPASAEPRRLNEEDFNDDGYSDVVGLFSTGDLGIACGDRTLTCEGTLADGTAFTGTSNVFKTVGRDCKAAPNVLAKSKKGRWLR